MTTTQCDRELTILLSALKSRLAIAKQDVADLEGKIDEINKLPSTEAGVTSAALIFFRHLQSEIGL